jgi:predicted enzyme related to lactoylglutathione lyase
MLRGLTTITYWADDLDAARDWYAEVLGVAPYFERPGADGKPGYYEFRVGDYQHELGLVNAAWGPTPSAAPAGVAAYWAVDDVEAAHRRLLELGATDREGPRTWGEGFTTASVIDPFGNILGVMENSHYHEVLATTGRS